MDVRDDARYTPARARLDVALLPSAISVEVAIVVTDSADFEIARLSAEYHDGDVYPIPDGRSRYSVATWTRPDGVAMRVVGPTEKECGGTGRRG